jgi:four helix bundle protein
MQDFRNLKVWSKAHAVSLAIYRATEDFPAAERYGLMSQMRRAAVSIAANIAEGCGRSSDADFSRFLHMAMGSASEVEYFLVLARDLKFIPGSTHDSVLGELQETKRMLAKLIGRLKADS